MECKCGCGQSCKGQYVHGHNRKGLVFNEEQKRKLSEAHKGKKHSEETKMKIGLGNKGKIRSEEHKRNLSKKLKGRHTSPKTQFQKGDKAHLGYKQSEITRLKISGNKERNRKISESRKGMEFSEEHKQKLKLHRATMILPTKDTTIEVKIQNFLKQLSIEFFTHQYMKIEHGYQCDVLIPSMNLVIECDGDYWHKYPTGRDIDHLRTKELIEKGFKVLRLWEVDIRKMIIEDFQIKLKEM